VVAGIDAMVELSNQVPENLYAKPAEINESKKLAKRKPILHEVTSWIEQSKLLPRMIQF
jgi:hypothetical protein